MEGDFGSRVMYNLKAFDLQWRFMLIFFGSYMILIGFLTLRAMYIPNLIGLLLVVGGVGYMIDNLKYFFYPDLNTGFLWFTYFGELAFMFWLISEALGCHCLTQGLNDFSKFLRNLFWFKPTTTNSTTKKDKNETADALVQVTLNANFSQGLSPRL